MKSLLLRILFAAIVLHPVSALAATWQVPDSVATIQAAIDTSVTGDTVMVSSGTYTENIDFRGKSIVVASQFLISGDTADISSTIIDGSAAANPDSAAVVRFVSGEDSLAVLFGFTIRGGGGLLLSDSTGYFGGGIAITGDASPTVTNNYLTDNGRTDTLMIGGAVAVRGGDSSELVRGPALRDNRVYGNSGSGPGVALIVESANCVLEHNVMYQNLDSLAAGVTSLIWLDGSHTALIGNTIIGERQSLVVLGDLPCSLMVVDNVFYGSGLDSADTAYVVQAGDSTSFDSLHFNCFSGDFTSIYDSIPFSGILDTIYTNFNGDTCDSLYNLYRDPSFCNDSPLDFTLWDYSVCPGAGSDSGLIGALGVGCYAYAGPDWWVAKTGSDSLGDGSFELPYLTIQRAVDAADSGHTVTVLPGTYTGEGNYDIDLQGKKIVLASLAGADSTIIDGENLGRDGFVMDRGYEDSTTIVHGFTVTNFTRGFDLYRSFPLLRQMKFMDNETAVYAYLQDEPVYIDSCRFVENGTGLFLDIGNYDLTGFIEATNFVGHTGIAVLLSYPFKDKDLATKDDQYGHIEFSGCRIDSNAVGVKANDVYYKAHLVACTLSYNGLAFKGGFYVNESLIEHNDTVAILDDYEGLRFDKSIIRDNTGPIALLEGQFHAPAEFDIFNSTVTGNAQGIRLFSPNPLKQDARVHFENMLYANNGGPIDISISDNYRSTINRSTFVFNDSGAIRLSPAAILDDELTNNIIAYNGMFGIESTDGDVSIACNNVWGNDSNYVNLTVQTDTNGNISADPFFCDPANKDFTLWDISPCVNPGGSCDTLMGAYGVGCIDSIPAIVSTDTIVAVEDTLVTYLAEFVDLDGPDTVITFIDYPSWMTPSADTISGTPTESDADTSFVVIVSDGYRADSLTVTVVVTPINDPPVLQPPLSNNVPEGGHLEIYVSGSDIDSDSLTLSGLDMPDNASLIDSGNGNGLFLFDPDFSQSGSYDVTFVVSDGALADSALVTIIVTDVNVAPVLDSVVDILMAEDDSVVIDIVASDFDNDSLTLSVDSLPLFAIFEDHADGTGSLTLTPNFDQSGSYDILLVVADTSLADSQFVTITVENTNRLPVFAPVDSQVVAEADTLTLTISAADPDSTLPALFVSAPPENVSFVDSANGTGVLTFLPSYFQAGVYELYVVADDGEDIDSVLVPIEVTNVNRAPELTEIGPLFVVEGDTLSITITGTDPDSTYPQVYSSELPTNATLIDHGDGTASFAFTPNYIQADIYSAVFYVSDSGLVDSELVFITVSEAGNQEPVLDAIGDRELAEEDTLSFTVTATDPDSTNPVLTVVGLPDGATFEDNGDGTGEFFWVPSWTQGAIYLLKFYATDDSLAVDSEQVVVTVSESPYCCVAATGNINGDSADDVDISDLTMLVNHLFIEFDPLSCEAEANTNGDTNCSVDISDLTKLVNHLFITFEPLAPCIRDCEGERDVSPGIGIGRN